MVAYFADSPVAAYYVVQHPDLFQFVGHIVSPAMWDHLADDLAGVQHRYIYGQLYDACMAPAPDQPVLAETTDQPLLCSHLSISISNKDLL